MSIKNILKYISAIICVLAIAGITPASAQDKDDSDGDKNAKEVSTTLIPGNKTGTFDEKAKFTYVVNNPTGDEQTGNVSYQVFTMKGEKLKGETIPVKIGKNSSGRYDFEIPESKAGFYKVNFMVNVTDYDDTTRRAFGIRPEELRSNFAKPADFDQFWDNAKKELASIPPNFKVTYLPDSTRDNRKVYLFEMKSLDNLTIRGYLTVPKVGGKNKKFAVLLGLPGYQVGLPPMFGTDNDLAIITLNVRGQGNSRDVIHTQRDEYIFYHIDDKNKYVMRGVIMDCVRAVDFIFSRPELNHDQIIVSGGSMGGFLAIATAAVDHRVALCSAQNPILSDINNLDGEVDWPLIDIRKYIALRPALSLSKVMHNLDYFDTKNFATMIKCPTLLGMGLLDPIVPPNNAYIDYNNLSSKKHLIIFRDLAHEVGYPYKVYEGRWMRDTFGLF